MLDCDVLKVFYKDLFVEQGGATFSFLLSLVIIFDTSVAIIK